MFRLISGLRSLSIRPVTASVSNLTSSFPTATSPILRLVPSIHPSQPLVANITFFNTPEADSLWKSMQGVSQQGKKRGRARNVLRRKNLNRGQKIGFGKAKVDFPGMTSQITYGTGQNAGRKTIQPLQEKNYEDYLRDLDESRSLAAGRRGFKRTKNPLERGWSGGKPLGRKFGPPISSNQELSFSNFDSVLLEFKTVFHMTGNLGRVRRTSVLMVTGNRNGTAGYTVSDGKYGKNMLAMRRAVNKAGLRLFTFPLYEDRTVYHDFFSQFGNSRVFVRQLPPGSGITAHRGIKAICEMIGIRDLYAKTEGARNIQHITKAFFLGLLRQRTHQDLADEKGLHLVEMRPENDFFPRVLASPANSQVRSQADIGHNEILDFEMISFEGHLPQDRPEKRHPWLETPGWDKHQRRAWATMSHNVVRQRMREENGEAYGAVRSHLWPKYSECIEMNKSEFLRKKREAKGGDTQ